MLALAAVLIKNPKIVTTTGTQFNNALTTAIKG